MSKRVNDAQKADVESILQMRRAYTTGGKVSARKMFVFDKDGNVTATVDKEPMKQGQGSPKQTKKPDDKKFGKLSSKMSVSAMSMGAESKVAFSDANYMPEEG